MLQHLFWIQLRLIGITKETSLWKPNDIITINLDFVNGMITFFKNDKVIGSSLQVATSLII